MMRYGIIGVCAIVLLGCIQLPTANAEVEVELNFFYDRLTPYGTWVERPHHGWVWYPANVGVGWRPYTQGHWIWTDDYGWYWASDFAWGWGPFHYGRWLLDNDYGWVWVPGNDWGPAWVAWRTGGGYFGWAPLPPEVGFRTGVGLQLGGFDLSVGIAQPAWVFVGERDFLRPHIHTVIVAPARNVTIIQQTTNVTNYVTVNNRIINRSVTTEYVERATRQKVRAVPVREVETASMQGERGRENMVNIFRPAVKPAPANHRPAPVRAEMHRNATRQDILQERHRDEQRQLERDHEQERQHTQIPAEQLQRQQEAERQSLRVQHEREHHVLQQRQMMQHHEPMPPQQQKKQEQDNNNNKKKKKQEKAQ